jgi:peptidoglycan hydrolase-like protein with peptidoglycan-binding domain
MRNALRRLAFGVLGTGMVVAAAAGVTAGIANAATAVPHYTAHFKPHLGTPPLLVWPTVSEGAHGNRVTTIQFLLNQSGFQVKVDGKFGSETKKRVMEFQFAGHLRPDGIVGSATWPALILTVKERAKGDAVRAVQSYLKYAYGFKTLKVDGVFGPATTKAVVEFQMRYHVKPADGVVGTTTWHTLVSEKA